MLTDDQFAQLLQFRIVLRRFLRWSESEAVRAGVTSSQHQLLVAARGHRGPKPPSVTDLAGYLLVRHHTAVGLIDGAQAQGLVQRHPDPDDLRVVRVTLTQQGRERLDALTSLHLEELRHVGPVLDALLRLGQDVADQ
ncbi:MAG: MarR family winged helix-turn-helix transcriptional regulator [Acidimicrobiales bacterium]